jgi:hypothetical protein
MYANVPFQNRAAARFEGLRGFRANFGRAAGRIAEIPIIFASSQQAAEQKKTGFFNSFNRRTRAIF